MSKDNDSIRDRLKSPAPTGDADAGGDSRGSDVSSRDFQQTDSTPAGDAGQRRMTAAAPTGDAGQEILDPAAAKRAEKVVAALFLLSVVGVVGFIATFFFWPFQFAVEEDNEYYTPLLGMFMALALGGIGAGAVQWAKTLMVDEETTQERHHYGSEAQDRAEAAALLKQGLGDSGLPGRRLLLGSLALGGGALALLPLPLVISFGQDKFSHRERDLRQTGWGKDIRLVRANGSPVKLGDLQLGGAESVFPDVPEGNRLADSAVLLIRMEPDVLTTRPGREDWSFEGHVAYSVICTHLGCPVKLYEQQTHNLLCPCHQSTFDASNGAKPKFGPAARPLPQLAISVDPEGYFVAQGDFNEPIGPSFWERDDTYSNELG